jgi:type I pantothenate kinase
MGGAAGASAAEAVVALVGELGARLVGVTGGVAAGKSTLAAAVAGALGPDVEVLATDGFLFPNEVLAERGIAHRKGFPESFDAAALAAALDRWRAEGRVEVPTYSHLHYDVVGQADVGGESLVVEGLHLAHPALGVRARFDLLVHVDADDDLLAEWYLERFRELRAAAADDPTAFLHPYRDVPAEAIEAMAVQVWQDVNLVVLHEEVRPHARLADLVVRLGPDHEVIDVFVPGPSF